MSQINKESINEFFLKDDVFYIKTTKGNTYRITNLPAAIIWGEITGTIGDQADLQSLLDGKSATGHTHAWGELIGTLSDQLDLQLALDAKVEVWGDIGGTLANQLDLQAALDLKASLVYVDSHLGGFNLDATVTAPTGTEDGYVVAWNDIGQFYELVPSTGTPTALSIGTITATTFGITSDGGVDDVVLPEANTTQAGLLGATKWNEIVANTAKISNATHTGDVTGSTALTIANGAVDIVMLSATGTPDATTFLRGDNTWAVPAGGGSSVGANNEVQTSDGAGGFVASNLFFDELTGDMSLGDSVLAGTTRGISAVGSSANLGLRLNVKGTGVVRILSDSINPDRLEIGDNAATAQLLIQGSDTATSGTVESYVLVQNNSSGGSALRVQVGGVGDPFVRWEIPSGSRFYALGIDNSDADTFKLTTATSIIGSDPSTGTQLLTITTTGDVNVRAGDLTIQSGYLELKNLASPTGIAGSALVYAKDSSDGSVNSTLGLELEQAVEAIGTFTASHKLKIWINAVEYWVQLDAVV